MRGKVAGRAQMRALAGGCFLVAVLYGVVAVGGGFEYPDNGTKAVGRGGAFTVRADDLSAIHHNPAGLAKLRGTHTLFNGNLVWFDASFRRAPAPNFDPDKCQGDVSNARPECQLPVIGSGDPAQSGFVTFDTVHNEAGVFPLGAEFALSSDFGLDDWTFAAGLFGPSAVGISRFPQTGPQRFMFVEKNLMVMFPTVSVAWKYKDIVGVGVSLHFMTMPKSKFSLVVDGYQYEKIYAVASLWEVLADLEIADPFGFTMTVGAWYRPWRFLEFGASAMVIPLHVSATGRVKVKPLPAYKPNCTPQSTNPEDPCQASLIYGRDFTLNDDSATLEFAFPAKVRAGVRYVHWVGDRPLFDLELDVHWEGWSAVDKFRVKFAEGAEITVELPAGPTPAALSNIDIIKNWSDTVSVRFGGDVMVVRDMLWLRAGAFWESAAEADDYSNLDFLAFMKWGIGGGFTVTPYPGLEFSAAYMHIFQETRNTSETDSKVYQQRPAAVGTDPRTYYQDLGGAPVGGGLYESSYDILSLGISLNWETLVHGREHRAHTVGRDAESAWAP